MSLQPRIPNASLGSFKGVAQAIGDIRRDIRTIKTQVNSIPAGGVSGTQIAPATVTAGNIYSGSIQSNLIQGTNIAAQAITSTNIYAGSIQANLIQGNNIAAQSITSANIYAGSIQANLIQGYNIAATTITATQIDATSIRTVILTANSITTGMINSGVVTSREINATSVSSVILTANSIKATMIDAANITATGGLSVVSATMGLVTGGIFQTNTSGARVMMGSGLTTPTGVTAGIVGIDGSNNVTFSIDATNGNVALKGTLQQGSQGLGNIGGVTQNAVLVTSGSNLLGDGSATLNNAGYTGSGNYAATIDSSVYLTAPYSYKVTLTTTGYWYFAFYSPAGSLVLATPGKAYSGSFFVRTSTADSVIAQINFYDASFATVGTPAGTAVSTVPGQWSRVSVDNAVAPAGTVYALLFVIGSGPAGEVANVDNAVMVQGPTAQVSSVIAGSITATEIAAGTITANQLASVSITAGTITVGGITAGTLTTGSILASQVSATNLSAFSADLGTITAGTITGAIVQTAASGQRVVMNSTGLKGFNSDGIETFGVLATGSIYVNSNPIVNPDFPRNVDGWTVTETISSLAFGWDGTHGNAVMGSMFIGSASATTYLGVGAIALAVTPGEVYKVRVSLLHSNGSGAYFVRMFESSAAALTTGYVGSTAAINDIKTSNTDLAASVANSTLSSTVWTNLVFTYTVPAGVYWVTPSIYNWGSVNGIMYVDDVSMRLQGTPASGIIRATNVIGGQLKGSLITGGIINGGVITGATLTGASIKTSTAGPAVNIGTIFSTGYVQITDSSNAVAIQMDGANGLAMPIGGASPSSIWFKTGTSIGGKLFSSTVSTQNRAQLQSWGVSGSANNAALYVAGDSTTNTNNGIFVQYNFGASFISRVLLDSSGASSWAFTPSDRNLKSNIEYLPSNGAVWLDRLRALKPATFNWKHNRRADIGLIAQDVKKVVPEAVARVGSGRSSSLTVQHNSLLALLVGAVQELDAKVSALTP